MQILRLFKKHPARNEPKILDFLPTRKEFFLTLWLPTFDKAKVLGLTDAEAEHTTGLIFEALFRKGRLDPTVSLHDEMLQLIRHSACFELRLREWRALHNTPTTSAAPAGADYYTPPMICARLMNILQQFWTDHEAHDPSPMRRPAPSSLSKFF
jgi:hypothetical protein